MLDAIMPTLLTILVFVIGAVVMVVAFVSSLNKATKYQRDITAYAAQRHYTFTPEPQLTLHGIISNSRAGDCMSGTLATSGNAFESFIASGDQSSVGGDSRSTGYTLTTFRVQIPDIRSHFILNSRKNDTTGVGILLELYQQSQRLQLEGDFNKVFDVLSVEDAKIDLLTLLTPDVMAYMVDNLSQFDIELIDDELLLYRPTIVPVNEYDAALALIDQFVSELRLRVADNRSTDPAAQPVSRIGEDHVVDGALAKRRSPSAVVMAVIIAGMLAVFVLLIIANLFPELGVGGTLIVFSGVGVVAIVLGALVTAGYKKIKK